MFIVLDMVVQGALPSKSLSRTEILATHVEFHAAMQTDGPSSNTHLQKFATSTTEDDDTCALLILKVIEYSDMVHTLPSLSTQPKIRALL